MSILDAEGVEQTGEIVVAGEVQGPELILPGKWTLHQERKWLQRNKERIASGFRRGTYRIFSLSPEQSRQGLFYTLPLHAAERAGKRRKECNKRGTYQAAIYAKHRNHNRYNGSCIHDHDPYEFVTSLCTTAGSRNSFFALNAPELQCAMMRNFHLLSKQIRSAIGKQIEKHGWPAGYQYVTDLLTQIYAHYPMYRGSINCFWSTVRGSLECAHETDHKTGQVLGFGGLLDHGGGDKEQGRSAELFIELWPKKEMAVE